MSKCSTYKTRCSIIGHLDYQLNMALLKSSKLIINYSLNYSNLFWAYMNDLAKQQK